MTNQIAFQGALGAYSDEACRSARPNMDPLPCQNFEEMIEAVRKGRGNGPRLGLAWPVKFIAAISPNSMSERGR